MIGRQTNFFLEYLPQNYNYDPVRLDKKRLSCHEKVWYKLNIKWA